MKTIDFRKDAKRFRHELEEAVKSLSKLGEPISALEFGYDCDQGGWIFIHADCRETHNRDGEWTRAIDDRDTIDMIHWINAVEANFEGEEIELIRVDGTRLVIPAFDEEADVEEDDDDAGPVNTAVGEMILHVVMEAKADGLFAALGEPGTIQLDIEDFNGGWAWPEFDELGRTNLA
ncbi:hypothetical protein Mal4_46750 [Maioricimonas rarisocia]|uniref:Uncharacterized protein n=1 Tax=Maioricimonas rarisocia TaxID=2528026 RepID=A0A517ZCY2_9PLAN|nr:hypothetical protein [Maioricimonas rarisocia]QDU40319.1 hypothetical protein Mal4_46750 [Maioricimonas rarisocia]